MRWSFAGVALEFDWIGTGISLAIFTGVALVLHGAPHFLGVVLEGHFRSNHIVSYGKLRPLGNAPPKSMTFLLTQQAVQQHRNFMGVVLVFVGLTMVSRTIGGPP